MTKIPKLLTVSFLAALICLTNCETADNGNEEENNKENINNDPKNNKGSSQIDINLGGAIFSIPSPIQTAMYIKEAGAEFDADALNSFENSDQYSTDFYKAFNMGVYGTDLGYCAIYENNDLCVRYMKTVRQIAEYIGLENAFSDDLLERFSNNIGIKDSMLVLVSEAYQETDMYLKENEKDDVAALVLAGGWIEAMYISCQSVQHNNNELIINRISEQKSALHSLIEMLEQLGTSDDYMDLTHELIELYDAFEKIEYQYEYIPSETNAANKTTLIKSKRKIIKTDELMNSITEKLIEIRNEYTQ